MTDERVPGVLEVLRPEGAEVPILFDSPRSGRAYPADFRSCQPAEVLRDLEDAFVDELIEAAPRHGVTLVKASVPRAYVDVTRASADVDPALSAEARAHAREPGATSELGAGPIPRRVAPGVPIYDRDLSPAEIEERIETYWRPYRRAVAELVQEIVGRHGRCVYLEWHSMKSVGHAATPDGPGVRRPDVVLGDRLSTTARPRLTGRLRNLFGDQGFRVRVNHPYAGGDLLRVVGDPQHGIDAVQISVNRALFLDESRGIKAAGFDACRARIEAVIEALVTRRLP